MKIAAFNWNGSCCLGLVDETNGVISRFDVPSIIAAISNGIELMPGDIIATGTPAGVGIGFKPPKYLVPGGKLRL